MQNHRSRTNEKIISLIRKVENHSSQQSALIKASNNSTGELEHLRFSRPTSKREA